MRIKILGCPDDDFKPYVIRALEFYAEQLLPSKKLRNNINLTLKFSDKLEVFAFASIEGYNTSGKARTFLLEMHPGIGAKEILKSLAHEMVHIKQFVRGETNETLSKWKDTAVNSDEVDYYQHPWELEAYGMEVGLFVKFVEKEHLWEVFEGIVNPNSPIENNKIKWKNVA